MLKTVKICIPAAIENYSTDCIRVRNSKHDLTLYCRKTFETYPVYCAMCLPNLRILKASVKTIYCTDKISISSVVNFHTYLKDSKEIKGERVFPYSSWMGKRILNGKLRLA